MANLTPAQLAQLQSFYSGGSSGWVPDYATNIDGTNYQRYDQFGGASGQNATQSPTGGYIGYDPNKTNPGDEFNNYGADGQFSNTGQFKDMSGLDPALIAFLVAAGGLGMGLAGGGSATFGGGGAAGAGAAGSTAAADIGTMYAGADAAAAGSLGGGASLSGAAGAGASATMAPLELMSTSGLGEALPYMSTGGTMSGLSSLLGPAATLLGAVAGSQGQKTSSTQQKDIPEWLKPYVLGNGTNPGLLNYANTLLNQQMQPGYLQGYDQMRSLGQSLLSAPVQGNGFNRFFPGK